MILKYCKIASGSSGNSFLIENLLIDCGVSMKIITEKVDVNLINYVIITHRHTDHVNFSTLSKLIKMGIVAYTTATNKKHFKSKLSVEAFSKVVFINPKLDLKLENLINKINITFTKVEHDVPNFALNLSIDVPGCESVYILYATDLSSTENLKAVNYHYYFLEGNYDEQKMAVLRKFATKVTKYGNEFNRFTRTPKTHLSKQECFKFINQNRGNNFITSEILHKSEVAYE